MTDRRTRRTARSFHATLVATAVAAAAGGCTPSFAPPSPFAPAGTTFRLEHAPSVAADGPGATAPHQVVGGPAPARQALGSGPAGLPSGADAPRPAADQRDGRTGGGSRSHRPGAGVLTIDLQAFLAAIGPAGRWRLLNTVADVATVSLSVVQGGVTTASATLTQADIAAGAVSHTFDGLPTGHAIVLVVAYDALGTPIGSASQVVVVSATGTSVADLEVQLVPASPGPGPGNALTASLTFKPAAGTVVGVFAMGYHRLLAAGDGYLYAMGIRPQGSPPTAMLGRFAPTDGAEIQIYLLDTSGPGGTLHGAYPLAYDAATRSVGCGAWVSPDLVTQPGDTSVTPFREALRAPVLVADGAGTFYHPADGTFLAAFDAAGGARPTSIPCFNAVDIDAAGELWTNRAATPSTGPADPAVYRYAADGTPVGTHALPFPAGSIRHDGTGGAWITDQAWRAGTRIVHVAADGTVGSPLTAPIADFCVDAAGNLWLAETTALVKVRPDGSIAGSFPIPATVVTAGHGYVYAGSPTGPDGTTVGSYVYKVAP